MLWFRRLVPILLLLATVWTAGIPPARAQAPGASSARFAFADTTLLRDTLNLSFANLFPLADSLRVKPDSLRAFAIRYLLPIERLAVLADSLGMPVDSVGPVLARERFNVLSQASERITSFSYNTTYTVNRQSTSWGNNASYDLVRGPALIHNVTSVRIDRIPEVGRVSFNRSKTASTEAGWKVLPDLALGMRVNLQRNEAFRLGSQRATSQNDFQGSLRSKHDFGDNRSLALNVFGGPFDEPRSSLGNASKRGLGTSADGRIEYGPPGWYAVDVNGNATLRHGRARVPGRTTFDTRDIKWGTNGVVNLFPQSRTVLRVTLDLDHDQTQRPTSFSQITTPAGGTTPDTSIVDQLIQEPSGSASVETALQIQAGKIGTLNLTGNLGRTTRLLASDQKTGIRFDQQLSHEKGFAADGQATVRGWSVDAHFNISRPEDEGPRRSVVNVTRASGAVDAVTVDYRERGITASRGVNGSLTRQLTPRVSFKARGDIGLTTSRYEISDSTYLGLTDGEHVATSDPHDDYRQSLRLETNYARGGNLSSTTALELGRVVTVYLRSDRSSASREDRLYRAEWLWTYLLFTGLTANQRNQINATYSRNVFAPSTNRLSMTYTTVTTLNARVTQRLQLDLTHNATYGPNGGYARSGDGLDYFNVSDATRDYSLSGRIGYTPMPAFTINLQPTYQANYRDDRSGGVRVPTLRRRELSMSGGASLNFSVGPVGRLTGNISRNLDARRDVPYRAGVPQPEPRSQSDFWSGQLQFVWSLQ